MRSRFLNTDYYASAGFPIETPAFLNLPVPHLPPLHAFNFFEDLPCLDSRSNIPLAIERLPIDEALSKFFAQVIPQPVYFSYGDNDADRSQDGEAYEDEQGRVGYLEKGAKMLPGSEVEELGGLGFQKLDAEFSTNSNESSWCNKHKKNTDIIQFEPQELDVFLEIACFSEKEQKQIFSEVLETANNQDLLKQSVSVQCFDRVQKPDFSFEDLTIDYQMEQNAYVLEDDSTVLDNMQSHLSIVPLLEVEETNLGVLPNISMEDEFRLLLDNMENVELRTSENEPFASIGNDIFELIGDNFMSKESVGCEVASVNVFECVDIMSMMNSFEMKENLPLNQFKTDCFGSYSGSQIKFQEFELFDMNSTHLFERFFDTERMYEPRACKSPFTREMMFKNFDELIVSNELALIDESFKSLPTPVVSDHARIRPLDAVIEAILARIKPEPPSASHEIYLDWHLLEGDTCNCKSFSSYQNILVEEVMPIYDFDWKYDAGGDLTWDFIISTDVLKVPNTDHEELLNMLSSVLTVSVNIMIDASSKVLNDKTGKLGDGEQLTATSSERASLLSKSMSHFNDLDIFLNSQKANSEEKVPSTYKAFQSISSSTISKAPGNSRAAHACIDIQFQHWDIRSCKIKLSDDIMALIGKFEKMYLGILQNDAEITDAPKLYSAANNLEMLSLPKKALMECITNRLAQRTSLNGDEAVMVLFTLFVIKQTAMYLSFYGIHAAHLYLDKICQELSCLKSSIGVLKSLIENFHVNAKKEITMPHPLLSFIYQMLLPNGTNHSFKVLIVADRVFWWSLEDLLSSMGISFNKLDENQPDPHHNSGFAKVKTDTMFLSDCLLVTHCHVTASFPFNKYNMILEYGGSYDVSRISSLKPPSTGLPRLHFFKIDLDNCDVCKALCEGVGMERHIKLTQVGEFLSIVGPCKNTDLQKLEEVLNFVPIRKENYIRPSETLDKVEACCMNDMQVPCISHVMESEQVQSGNSSPLNAVIIVNTQNLENDMVISRRSVYKKILAMEKGGTQAVERDLVVPIDIIISSDTCLVWYDCRNIGNKATTLNEASSCLPLCIENIATDILTSLSLTFGCCILVFEGESSFLSTVMESSDGLYAAAASLSIDLQVFYSNSAELTDEIILSCIVCANRWSKSIYPKMPESETLAESFLTKFPSINPLTAHAILSEGMLIEFLMCSHDCRIRALHKYHVTDDSVALFSALCRFGEREDSKSLLTDCSSVSSGPDSDKCHMKIRSGMKQRKCVRSSFGEEIGLDKLFHSGPANQFPDETISQFAEPSGDWMSEYPDVPKELKTPFSSINNLGDKQGFDIMSDSSTIFKPYDKNSIGHLVLDELKAPGLCSSEKLLGQNHGQATLKNKDLYPINKSDNQQDNFIGEVIDLTISPLLDDKFSFDNDAYLYSAPELKEDSTRNSKIVRKLSFDRSDNPCSFVAPGVNSNSAKRAFVKNQRRRFGGKHYEQNILDKGSLEVPRGDSNQLAFAEDISHYGATSFSKAIGSAKPQPGSPWTIEFLNRIKEKSRLRQQSLPCDTPEPDKWYSRNISGVTKKRSPSILEFFSYQGKSAPRTVPEVKRQKGPVRSSSTSKNKGASSSFRPTWTPIDKRARQTLSYATSGGGNQAKLVWSEGDAHGIGKTFQDL